MWPRSPSQLCCEPRGTSPLDQAIRWAGGNGSQLAQEAEHRHMEAAPGRAWRCCLHHCPSEPQALVLQEQGSGPRMWLLLWGGRVRQMD